MIDQRKSYATLKYVTLSLLTLAIVSLLCSAIFLVNAAKLLTLSDPLPTKKVPALILMGDVVDRSLAAADLFQQTKLIDRLFFFVTKKSDLEQHGLRKNDADLTETMLLRHGVPKFSLVKVQGFAVNSTRDEAQQALIWIKNNTTATKELIIITSWYHSSRTRWIFKRIFAGSGINIIVRTDLAPQQKWWWHDKQTILHIFQEYLKWIYYLYSYS